MIRHIRRCSLYIIIQYVIDAWSEDEVRSHCWQDLQQKLKTSEAEVRELFAEELKTLCDRVDEACFMQKPIHRPMWRAESHHL